MYLLLAKQHGKHFFTSDFVPGYLNNIFSIHSLILLVLGHGQSKINLEIGLEGIFVRRPGSEALREVLAKNKG